MANPLVRAVGDDMPRRVVFLVPQRDRNAVCAQREKEQRERGGAKADRYELEQMIHQSAAENKGGNIAEEHGRENQRAEKKWSRGEPPERVEPYVIFEKHRRQRADGREVEPIQE